MAGQVPKKIRSERVARLGELETQLRQDYFATLVGKQVQLLTESSHPHPDPQETSSQASETNAIVFRGTTCRYVPAELSMGATAAKAIEIGNLIEARVIRSTMDRLIVQPYQDR